MLDNFKRYQLGLKLHHLYPQQNNFCACGCGELLTGRKKRWYSSSCSEKAYEILAVIKGNSSMVRKLLYNRDNGYCNNCGVFDINWEADHIIPVMAGGGACQLDNYQTLCDNCHKEKTKNHIVSHLKAISSQEAVNASTFLLNAAGEKLYSF